MASVLVKVAICEGCVMLATYGEDNLFQSEIERSVAFAALEGMPHLSVDSDQDGHFSWRSCDCCDSGLGGMRYDATFVHTLGM